MAIMRVSHKLNATNAYLNMLAIQRSMDTSAGMLRPRKHKQDYRPIRMWHCKPCGTESLIISASTVTPFHILYNNETPLSVACKIRILQRVLLI